MSLARLLLLCACMMVGLLILSLPQRADAAGQPTKPACEVKLAKPVQGKTAVRVIGHRMHRVADDVKMSVRELRTELLTDRTLWVDRCGDALYVDPPTRQRPKPGALIRARAIRTASASVIGQVVRTNAPPTFAPTDIEPSAAFTLHSRPGSQRTVYLDFDGGVVTGTAWNRTYGSRLSAPAYDTDGSPTTFSDAERRAIIEIWLRVAEDYAPFDVDVTTAQPTAAAITRLSTADPVYGTRVMISPQPTISGSCGCGGVAYMNVFAQATGHAFYQPAWVFPNNLLGTKSVAEAASHEVGHNLGLSHDGTASSGYYMGSGGWAPIMGAAYDQPVSQWSRGEYAGASNREDDLDQITANGLSYASDDHGDSAVKATPLTVGTSLPGIIGTSADSDWFAVSTDGPTTVRVTPAQTGPDLDVGLRIYDSGGNLTQTVAPVFDAASWQASMGARAVLLVPGTWYVRVDGVGNGRPGTDGASDYASLGSYRIAATAGDSVEPLVNTTTTLEQPSPGIAYNAELTAAGGQGPYTWSAEALPKGLSIDPAGALSGTPTSGGSFTARITVTDSSGSSDTRIYAFTVETPKPLTIATTSAPVGVVGTPYSVPLRATGVAGLGEWSISSGSLPTGLELLDDTIAGTPATSSTTSVVIKLVDAMGRTVTRSLSLRITATSITTPNMSPGIIGKPFTFTPAVTGGTPPYTWASQAMDLPAGLGLDAGTGRVTGNPTAPGSFTIALTASDANGVAATKSYVARFTATTVSTASLNAGMVASPYSGTLAANGGTPPYIWEVVSGSLPDGMTLTSAGAFQGRPMWEGTYALLIRATDANGVASDKSLTLLIKPANPVKITSTSLARGVQGGPYSAALSGSGGVPPLTWSTEGLPQGLSQDPATGRITGTPLEAGTFPVSVRLTDARGSSAVSTFDMTVTKATVTTTSLPIGAVPLKYQAAMAASYGIPPYSWTLSSGDLPEGLSMSSAGLISGTPNQEGTYDLTLRVTDAKGATNEKALALVIKPPAKLTVVAGTMPMGKVGLAYSGSLAGSGGVAPYTWDLESGSLPQGLALDPARGSITGIPSEAGSFTLSVRVRDGRGTTAVATRTISVTRTTITTSALPVGRVGLAYSASLASAGGTPTIVWRTDSALPPGLALSSAGRLTGVPTASGSYPVTFVATDAKGVSDSRELVITIG